MRQTRQLWITFTIGAVVLTGCARITTRVVETPRVDQEVQGNRGYLQGSAPPVSEREKTRQMVQTDIELPTLRELNPWKKPAPSPAEGPAEGAPQASLTREPQGGQAAAVPPPAPSRTVEFTPVPEPAPARVWEEEPPVRIVESPARVMPPQPTGTAYTVQKGDTLQKIASQFYGTSRKWQRIYEANRDVLKNPNRVYPGQKLFIPDLEEAQPVPSRGEETIK